MFVAISRKNSYLLGNLGGAIVDAMLGNGTFVAMETTDLLHARDGALANNRGLAFFARRREGDRLLVHHLDLAM